MNPLKLLYTTDIPLDIVSKINKKYAVLKYLKHTLIAGKLMY